QPRDVLVVCPDLERFAPLIESVFGRGELPIPVRVSDLSLGTDNPVAAALDAVLDAISNRCTAAEGLALCSLDAVQRKLGFEVDDVERIDRWVDELGATWGFDAEQRRQWLSEDVDAGTWTTTLDRLLVGAVMPAPVARPGALDIVPFDDMDADAVVI